MTTQRDRLLKIDGLGRDDNRIDKEYNQWLNVTYAILKIAKVKYVERYLDKLTRELSSRESSSKVRIWEGISVRHALLL